MSATRLPIGEPFRVVDSVYACVLADGTTLIAEAKEVCWSEAK